MSLGNLVKWWKKQKRQIFTRRIQTKQRVTSVDCRERRKWSRSKKNGGKV